METERKKVRYSMLKEAKKWIQHLEEVLTELSTKYQKPFEEIEDAWEQFWYDGGNCYDQAVWEIEAVDAFKESYEIQMEDDEEEEEEEDSESTALDEIRKKMREFADRRDYDLTDEEFEEIVAECAEEGKCLEDCPDGMLREIVEDWVADHS